MIDDDAIEAMLAETRASLEPEKYAQFEAQVRESQRLAKLEGAEGDEARLTLDLILRVGRLTHEQRAELSWVIGGMEEGKVLPFPGIKPPDR